MIKQTKSDAKYIIVDGIRLIQLNRPRKKNAISSDMFLKITESFKEANNIDSIKVIHYFN